MNLFVFAEVVKTRGLRGCLKALSFLESSEILDRVKTVYLEEPSGQTKRYQVRKINPAGKFLFLELKDVSDVDQARALVGSKLLLPRSELKTLPENEYYWQDIIGLNAVTPEGCRLGTIEAIFPTGSNDVYVCRDGKKEYLLPAIADVIVRIDLASRTMTVKVPEGLQP